jgi:hypothetical protein
MFEVRDNHRAEEVEPATLRQEAKAPPPNCIRKQQTAFGLSFDPIGPHSSDLHSTKLTVTMGSDRVAMAEWKVALVAGKVTRHSNSKGPLVQKIV